MIRWVGRDAWIWAEQLLMLAYLLAPNVKIMYHYSDADLP
jgi:hypothetical protein